MSTFSLENVAGFAKAYPTGTSDKLPTASESSEEPPPIKVRDYAAVPRNGPRGYYVPHPPTEALASLFRAAHIRNNNAVTCGKLGLPYPRGDLEQLGAYNGYHRAHPKHAPISLGGLKRYRSASLGQAPVTHEQVREAKRQRKQEERDGDLTEYPGRPIQFSDSVQSAEAPRFIQKEDGDVWRVLSTGSAPPAYPLHRWHSRAKRGILKRTQPAKTVSYDLRDWLPTGADDEGNKEARDESALDSDDDDESLTLGDLGADEGEGEGDSGLGDAAEHEGAGSLSVAAAQGTVEITRGSRSRSPSQIGACSEHSLAVAGTSSASLGAGGSPEPSPSGSSSSWLARLGASARYSQPPPPPADGGAAASGSGASSSGRQQMEVDAPRSDGGVDAARSLASPQDGDGPHPLTAELLDELAVEYMLDDGTVLKGEAYALALRAYTLSTGEEEKERVSHEEIRREQRAAHNVAQWLAMGGEQTLGYGWD